VCVFDSHTGTLLPDAQRKATEGFVNEAAREYAASRERASFEAAKAELDGLNRERTILTTRIERLQAERKELALVGADGLADKFVAIDDQVAEAQAGLPSLHRRIDALAPVVAQRRKEAESQARYLLNQAHLRLREQNAEDRASLTAELLRRAAPVLTALVKALWVEKSTVRQEPSGHATAIVDAAMVARTA
jgi:cell division protein FtsB